jgi:citrate synthase
MSSSNPPQGTDTRFWDDRHGVIRSRAGGALIDQDRIFTHGYSLLDDLAGRASFFQVMFLHATGRMPELRLAKWVEAAYICMSWPDPRIWCNQIGALGGTTGTSAVAATVAGLLAADSTMYGSLPLLEGVRFIADAVARRKRGTAVEQIVREECEKHGGKPAIVGYARPVTRGDRRVATLERAAAELGFARGEHVSLAYEIQEVLLRDFGESMNINGYASAFLSDRGYTAEEVYRLSAMCVLAGVMACFVEERDKALGSFLPLRCDDIEYQGKGPRSLPER